MPDTIEIFERRLSRDSTLGTTKTVDFNLIARGSDDDVAVKNAMWEFLETRYDGMTRQDLKTKCLGEGLWDGVGSYTLIEDDLSIENLAVSFSTGGGTQHIQQSISTVGSYAAPGAPIPNYKGAIGVEHDGTKWKVAGVDIEVPVFEFELERIIDPAEFDAGYIRSLKQLTSKTNDAPWHEYDTGEVKFMGASGGVASDGSWKVRLKFAASDNKTGIQIGDIAGIAKRGWEYLWVLYEDAEDGGKLVKSPRAAYVEQVYYSGSFSFLGI